MSWKKLNETNDFISFEKEFRSFRVRIEARLEENLWRIYKIYYNDKNIRLVEEFYAADKKRLSTIMRKLKSEKDLSIRDIRNMSASLNARVTITLSRAYKEYEFEKWYFAINDGEKENVAFLHFGQFISVDLVINQRYRHLKDVIIERMNQMLGIADQEKHTHIYFFNLEYEKKDNPKSSGMLFGKIEVGLGIDDD